MAAQGHLLGAPPPHLGLQLHGLLCRGRNRAQSHRRDSGRLLPLRSQRGRHGDIRSGASCRQSLGLTNPPAARRLPLRAAEREHTGRAPNLSSAALSVACPQASIAGYAGSTGNCVKTGGTLTLPAGGNADASGSKGNLAEASFVWTFTGASRLASKGRSSPCPGATGFTLTITFPGGYQATASGPVTIVDSTPVLGIFLDAAGTQSPTLIGGAYYLSAGTKYYLKDTEAIPPPLAQFFLNNGSADISLGTVAGSATFAWHPTSVCPPVGCSVKVTVGTISSQGRAPSLLRDRRRHRRRRRHPRPPRWLADGFGDGSDVGLEKRPAHLHGERERRHRVVHVQLELLLRSELPEPSPGGSTTTCTYSTAGVYTVVARVPTRAGRPP